MPTNWSLRALQVRDQPLFVAWEGQHVAGGAPYPDATVKMCCVSLLPLGSALNSSAKAATLAAAPAAKGGLLSQKDSTGAAIALLCVLNARGPAKLKQGAELGAPAQNAALLSADCSAKDDRDWM